MAVTSIENANFYSISRLAELFGHTRETVAKKLKASGAKPAKKYKGYDVYALRDVAIFTGGLTLAEETPFSECDPDKLPPKDRDAWYSSENRRLAFEKSQKQLLDANDSQQFVASAFKKIALGMETLADVLERDVGLSSEQINKTNLIVDNLRSELAQELIKFSEQSNDAS